MTHTVGLVGMLSYWRW